MRSTVVTSFTLLALASAGCPADDLPCVEVDPDCQPLYEPTFDNIFSNTLVPSCAPEGGACHSADGNKGGISYVDADSAYDLLLGNTDGRARVVPFDAPCSMIVQRINAARPSQLMPPGDPLSAAERCAIEKWVAAGAER